MKNDGAFVVRPSHPDALILQPVLSIFSCRRRFYSLSFFPHLRNIFEAVDKQPCCLTNDEFC
ncbi:hypothetical protein, partial [Dickeya dadantii]|uniref:hypothetical protein n=1 Tax=Dickeya dadantii TaxID=204038 RepID=UPI001C37C267